ncbi:SpoIID/LytB domain-containing protein [Nocardioides islandensis]|uniref:SpoIID/LytB domain-containing protein n=1 Tax=Nocardioides islandensis TaxID=433663 RepID=A0A930YL78_9ACTN|nr:SpoIID/LytB domain-containing protein [Nocardioides islandensis]MBF4764355.1 SpoIID/LytB domain-containing protein [Nocardioides islandensis]
MPRTRTSLPALPLVAMTAAALTLAALPAEAAAPVARKSEVWTITPTSTIAVDGHGYGHGRGMSQYGSEGAARQGLTSAQIMDFYYPGTTTGQLGGQVRVWITADNDSNTIVVARPGLKVRDLATRTKTPLPDKGATKWRLAAGSGTKTLVSFFKGRWVTWKTLKGDAELSAGGQPITLVLPHGKVAYRGALASRAPKPGKPKRRTVNRLPLDSYLKGVVPRETFTSWHPAALESQAIAARTYAAYEMQNPLSSIYQICDTTSCQVYGGFTAEYASTNAAVDATAGQVRRDAEGTPAFTQFSSSNGGWSAAGSVPYLVAQQDPYDGWSGNPNTTWTLPLTAGNVEKNYPAVGTLTSIAVDSRDGNGEWGGRATTMTLTGTGGSVQTTGEDFRLRVGLKSSWFTLRVTG